MKRGISFLLILFILVSVRGCRTGQLQWTFEATAPATTDASTAPTDLPQATEQPTTVPEETVGPTVEQTLPPETQPPETQPPVTEPPATQPPETKPPVTQPPETKPPATQPPATEPPATQPPATDPPTDPYDIYKDTVTALEQEIMDLINAEREKAGLEPLAIDPRLCAITSVRAYECSILFDHTRPNGKDCFSVLEEYGFLYYRRCGENILFCSVGYYDAAEMVGMWMNSEGHRGNILSEDFNKMGLAVYEANGFYYAANLFTGE